MDGKLVKPKSNTIPNAFNYQKYLYYQNIYYTFKVQSLKIINSKSNIFYQSKNYLMALIANKPHQEYYYAFMLGDKSYINEDTWENYQKNGITHLFAISGMHLGILVGILKKIFHLLHLSKNKCLILYSVFLLYFLFITNFSPSTLRAALFFILLFINRKWHLELSNFQILLFTALILLSINPFLLFQMGFQFSFLATAGLLLNEAKYQNINYFKKLLYTSFIAIVFTLPISLINFYEINLLSILLNIIFIPLVSLIVYPLILISFCLPFLDWLMSIILLLMETLAKWGSCFNLSIVIPKINLVLIAFYYLNVLGFIKYRRSYFIFIILVIGLFWKTKSYFDPNSYVYLLDVGQGDSILIKSKYQKEIIMIDTGGQANSSYHVSDNTITFLKSLGLKKIDLLIITHGDYDHAGEIFNLAREIKLQNIMLNQGEYMEIEKDILNSNLPVVKSYQSKYIPLEFLNTKVYDDENNNSLVTLMQIENYRFLFMGDAEKEKEKDLLENYYLKDITFLKVGHHGSNTSSSKEFIKTVKPKYSLISVGLNNIYGHPSKETLQNLSNSQIYRTDKQGTIEIILNKNVYQIKSFL